VIIVYKLIVNKLGPSTKDYFCTVKREATRALFSEAFSCSWWGLGVEKGCWCCSREMGY
jgi:hypothetical protein